MDENKAYTLIMAYLQKQLTAEEEKAFYEWIQSSAENKILYFELKGIHDTTLVGDKVLNTKNLWGKLQQKRRVSSAYKLLRPLISYAAITFVAIALTSLYFNKEKTTPSTESSIQYISGNGIEANQIILTDGTVVSIGTKTHINLSADYGIENRTVHLEGEAYFEVAKDATKPFIVKTGSQSIEALGTAFNVTAYPKDSRIITTLNNGAVRITTKGKDKSIDLAPNQQLIYNKNTCELKKQIVDANEFCAWKAGYYHFNEVDLVFILNRLGHVYGANFQVKTTRLNNHKFTGTFYRGQSLEDLLEVITLSVPIRYTIHERDVLIK
jgi:ferric-dicitrate binding protein FerR (iron transport regulator)